MEDRDTIRNNSPVSASESFFQLVIDHRQLERVWNSHCLSIGRASASILVHGGKRLGGISSEAFLKASARLGDAVIDPACWPSVMEDLCRAAGVAGAVLLQSDIRTPDVPRTGAVGEFIDRYFGGGWHTRDPRADRATPLLVRGAPVVIDQDIFTPAEIDGDASYNEFYIPSGFKWWAVIGFWSGAALWGFSFQRTPGQGAFNAEDKTVLAQISQRLSETATLSKAVSRSVLTGMMSVLSRVQQPAVAVDRHGFVLDMNAAADLLFDDDIRVLGRRLVIADKLADAEWRRLVNQLRVAADDQSLQLAPIVVRRRSKAPVLVRVLPIEQAARSPFLGARALLTLQDLGDRSVTSPALLSQMFGLTPAEASLASLIGAGESISQAADQLNISAHTARTQLKAIFAKTDMHRQTDLVAFLSRLGSFPAR